MLTKYLCTWFFENTCPCKNAKLSCKFFLNFIQDVKKWVFDVHYNSFTSKIRLRRHPITLAFQGSKPTYHGCQVCNGAFWCRELAQNALPNSFYLERTRERTQLRARHLPHSILYRTGNWLKCWLAQCRTADQIMSTVLQPLGGLYRQ